MAGVCWDCGLLVVRVSARVQTGGCSLCQPTEATTAAAIRYAAGWNGTSYNTEPRARIISFSLNSPDFDGIECGGDTIQDAVNEAYAQGCIIIVAAGNAPNQVCWEDDEKCDTIDEYAATPISTGIAIMPSTITVGGACLTGDAWHCWSRVNPLISDFSGCCPAPDETDWCDLYYPLPWPWPAEADRLPVLSVVAPMSDMFSTWADGVVGTSNDDFDSFVDGTSIVPPQIAGIVALMLKANPALTFEEVKQILEVTATDITEAPASVGYDRYTGHGLVNARKAVQRAILQGLPADWNGDGVIGPIDPILYFADYTAADSMTDLDLDTAQTSNDMTIFLDSYNNN